MPPTDTLPLNPLKGPVVLCIMDGWGHREETQDNAVALAHTPIYDRLWKAVPQAFLETSGHDVGLPHGQMGNSEVGHTNLGAGRVVMQDLPRIDKAIEDTTLADKPALKHFIATLQKRGGTCHLMGLVSPGGVHAHQDHLVALAKAVAAAGVRVIVHAFLDGRDTPPKSARDYVAKFTADLGESATIGTVCGRYFAMDRDKNWDRVSLAFAALVTGDGAAYATADEAIAASYAEGITDEFVRPASLDGYPGMADGDGLLMGNFRADRARQVLTALVD
ncbi:MAG: 2,3-bisphosphoglycerate-independent phosphoglycerate mutase, partial [Pseudomonadota bacterium]